MPPAWLSENLARTAAAKNKRLFQVLIQVERGSHECLDTMNEAPIQSGFFACQYAALLPSVVCLFF
jgi:hypothetical protein